MSMIERAARAIAEALGDKLDNVPVSKREWIEERGMFDGAFRDINLPFRSDYEDAARAVLLAIREPNGEVMQAGNRVWLDGGNERQIYETMIDAALDNPTE